MNETRTTFSKQDFAKGKKGLRDILEELAREVAMENVSITENENFIDAILDGVGNALILLDDAQAVAHDDGKGKAE